MKEKITVFGSFNVDLMGRAPHLPVPGETVKGGLFRQGPGGKGFNQAVAAHKAGADVAVIAKLGRDPLAQIALQTMDELSISKEYLLFDETQPTGTALIMVDDRTAENMIMIEPGANDTISDADLAGVADAIKSSAYLLLQLEINQDANEKAAALAKKNGVRVIINTAPYQSISDAFLNGAYLVTPNEVEAEELTGIAIKDLASADRAAAVFFSKGVQNVIITLGSRGVYLNDGKSSQIVPAYRVDAIDTTGAGDAFNGGLIAALAEGKSLPQAVGFANALAALSVQRLGTTTSMPTREEIDTFLAERT